MKAGEVICQEGLSKRGTGRTGTREEEMRTTYNAIYVCNAVIKHSMIT